MAAEIEPGGAAEAGHEQGSHSDVAANAPAARVSMCFATAEPGFVLQGTDPGFGQDLKNFYDPAESDANEALIRLKLAMVNATDEQFWATTTEGIALLGGAQYSFISKRIIESDHSVPVEMPPIGTKGSCLLGLSYYYNDKIEATFKDPHSVVHTGIVPNIRYDAYAAPCAYMKHDKVFIIPGNGDTFVPHDQNPNSANLVCPMVSYIGIPLFSDGKCFAHFGLAWGPEGERQRKLSWGFLESALHSLEDIIQQRILSGSDFGGAVAKQSRQQKPSLKKHIVPHEAIAEAQSLKPYARSLSHELRTPMQGVVGMLDLMMATVQESMEGCTDQRSVQAFKQLKEYIESTQDSSHRAVEAADNVVHAYDMNMGVPEAFSLDLSEDEDEEREVDGVKVRKARTRSRARSNQPGIVITGGATRVPFGTRLGRRRGSKPASASTAALKRKRVADSDENEFVRAFKRFSPGSVDHMVVEDGDFDYSLHLSGDTSGSSPSLRTIAPGLRNCNVRDLVQGLVADSLRFGGRPEHAIAEATDNGESIEVAMRQPNGLIKTKHIIWDVDPEVPETLLIDERDLHKCLANIFSNAVKFTDEGKVVMKVKLGVSRHSRYIVINIVDSGPGIPDEFIPHLFKAFSREDPSTTRTTEGLGLGLMVAKNLAHRKLRGDVNLIRTETKGPKHGSEFELRVPITPNDAVSRPATPAGSPSPSLSRNRSTDSPGRAELAPSRLRQESHSPHPAMAELPTSAPRDQPLSPHSSMNGHQPIHAPVPTRQPLNALAQALQGHQRERSDSASRRPSTRPLQSSGSEQDWDRQLAKKYPLNILVAEDNKINRKLLVNMLKKLGYNAVYEAYDGLDAVRQVESLVRSGGKENVKCDPSGRQNAARGLIDVVLMDLWMPYMDGYEATEKILNMQHTADGTEVSKPTVLAVSADVTAETIERVDRAGMKGFLAKPFQIRDLQDLIVKYVSRKDEFE